MKLSSLKKLWKSDYSKEFQQLIDQMSITLNSNLEQLYNMANNQISLRDNILCAVKSVQISVKSDGTPVNKVGIPLTQPVNIEGISVIQVLNNTKGTSYTQSGLQVFYTTTTTGISIDAIKGLNTGDNYTIKLIIWQF